MVWIYGGGFRCGGNNAPLYDFTNFIAASIQRDSPVVAVCINHRMRDFGFLASKELKEDIDNDPTLSGEQKAVGNWGLQDQKLAFLWIHDHISAFHGNPKDITAVGSSTGAVSIGFHMVLPAHHGLFQKAILQSAAPLTSGTQDIEGDGQRYFDRLCQHFGIPKDVSSSDKVARLRALPEMDLAAYSLVNGALLYRPTVDGVLIDQHVAFWHDDLTRLDPGIERVLLGMNQDEGNASGAYAVKRAESWSVFRTRQGGSHPELGRAFDQIYGQPTLGCSGQESNRQAAQLSMRAIGDGLFQAPVLSLASTLLRSKVVPGLGASHLLELLYLLNSAPCQHILTPQEQAFAKRVQSVWLEFIATSNTTTNPQVIPRVSSFWGAPTPGSAKKKDDGDKEEVGKECEKNVIVFRRDLTIDRSDVDWFSKEKFEYWTKVFEYQRERLAQEDYDSHGMPLNITPVAAAESQRARL
ncbi:hypothetical protein EC968_005493 [Mortierella alpina]|nr:hypothetical protein EC968_005493 [Mortierella alpina]